MGRCGATLRLALEGNIGIGGGTRGTEGAAGPEGRGGAGGAGGFGVRWKGGGASWSIPGCELMSIIILIITAVGGTPNPRAPGSWEGGYKGCPWVRDTQACATFPGAGFGRDTQAHARFLRVGLDYPRLTSHSQELGGGGGGAVLKLTPCSWEPEQGDIQAHPAFPGAETPTLTPSSQ